MGESSALARFGSSLLRSLFLPWGITPRPVLKERFHFKGNITCYQQLFGRREKRLRRGGLQAKSLLCTTPTPYFGKQLYIAPLPCRGDMDLWWSLDPLYPRDNLRSD